MKSQSVLVLLVAALYAVAPASAKRPQFSWDSVGGMSFWHSSNTSGLLHPDAAEFVATHFQIVTAEKWTALDVHTANGEDMFDLIVKQLLAIEAINSNVTTIFYYNSVCNFPQYTSLYDQFQAMPDGWLRDSSGKPVMLACAGFSAAPVFDHSNSTVRSLWISECVNATKMGIDGCFEDRAIDGVPGNLANKTAFDRGHTEVAGELQDAIGEDNLLVCNHCYGPPFDTKIIPSNVDADMIEFCTASNTTINQMQASQNAKRIVECHVEKSSVNDTLAAFLMAAYHDVDASGRGYGSYFGFGPWSSADEYTETWSAQYYAPVFDAPLGMPAGPATLADNVWRREFEYVTVTFSLDTKKGTFTYK